MELMAFKRRIDEDEEWEGMGIVSWDSGVTDKDFLIRHKPTQLVIRMYVEYVSVMPWEDLLPMLKERVEYYKPPCINPSRMVDWSGVEAVIQEVDLFWERREAADRQKRELERQRRDEMYRLSQMEEKAKKGELF